MPYHQNGTDCLPQVLGLLSQQLSPYFPFGWPFHPERDGFSGILLCFFFFLRWFFNLRKDDSPLLYLAVDCGISGDWGFSSSHRSSFLPICRSSMSIFIGITNVIIVIIIISLPSQRSPMSIFIATIIGFSSLSAITTSHKVWKLKRRRVIPKVAEIALQFNIPFVESYTSQGK